MSMITGSSLHVITPVTIAHEEDDDSGVTSVVAVAVAVEVSDAVTGTVRKTVENTVAGTSDGTAESALESEVDGADVSIEVPAPDAVELEDSIGPEEVDDGATHPSPIAKVGLQLSSASVPFSYFQSGLGHHSTRCLTSATVLPATSVSPQVLTSFLLPTPKRVYGQPFGTWLKYSVGTRNVLVDLTGAVGVGVTMIVVI